MAEHKRVAVYDNSAGRWHVYVAEPNGTAGTEWLATVETEKLADELAAASKLADACKEAEEFLTVLEPPARTARWAEWSRRRQGVLKQLRAALAPLED